MSNDSSSRDEQRQPPEVADDHKPSPAETRKERQKMLELSAVGLAFPIAIAIGYFFGRTVGSWWDHPGLGGLIGVLLGVAAGFHNLLRATGRMDD
jgi:F0F1-type ATP synthase assembly protein I